MSIKINQYSPAEERINITSHALGIGLSLLATLLLILKACHHRDAWHIVSFTVFGACMVTLYVASTLYHSASQPDRRRKLKIFDHAAIFLMIAGTYTPFTLVTLRGVTGWVLFGSVWSLALTGIGLKLFFTGRMKVLSTLMYVGLGWLVIFVIKPLLATFPVPGLIWLVVGGILYTSGALIYSIGRIRFNHAIFHTLVLGGSFCHWMTIYLFV